MIVARTQPEVVAPMMRTVSTPCFCRIELRSVPKNAEGYRLSKHWSDGSHTRGSISAPHEPGVISSRDGIFHRPNSDSPAQATYVWITGTSAFRASDKNDAARSTAATIWLAPPMGDRGDVKAN